MKQYYCLLERFNNYFNRKIIKYESLSDYESHSKDFFIPENADEEMIPFDFNPNDNVTTEIIVNSVPFSPDYFLLMDEEQNIISRWFVIEEKRNRQGQWLYSLRRDVIADNLSELLDAPIFIHKAKLKKGDPFIFNSEGMSFNQIKKSETLLKDKTKCAWVVGYIAKNAAPSDITITVPDIDFKSITLGSIASAMGISESNLASLLNFDGLNTNEAKITKEIRFSYHSGSSFPDSSFISSHHINNPSFYPDLSDIIDNWYGYTFTEHNYLYIMKKYLTDPTDYEVLMRECFNSAIIGNKNPILSALPTILNRVYVTDSQFEILKGFSNDVIFYNGDYYKIQIATTESGQLDHTGEVLYTTWPSVKTAVEQAASAMGSNLKEMPANGTIEIQTLSDTVYIQMVKVSNITDEIPSITTRISSGRRVLTGQSFDMFCIPYGSARVDDGSYFRTNETDAINVAAEIARELNAECYDIQLLPFCPCVDLVNDSGIIDLTGLTEGKEFDYILNTGGTARTSTYKKCVGSADAGSGTGYYATAYIDVAIAHNDIVNTGYIRGAGPMFQNPTVTITSLDATHSRITFRAEVDSIAAGDSVYVYIWYDINSVVKSSIILWANNNTFSSILNYSLISNENPKIESECNKYRLVSPNYQGTFDFNLAKNGGMVHYFIAECTYKPYTPYMKVSPAFNYLYGTNFGDCRGLICGGDYSLPRVTDQWESFELNNKNYQNIFNRDIQHLDFEQSLEMRQQLITGGLAIFGAGAAGAAAGAKVGGGYGAAAGALIGVGASGLGYALDVGMLAERQRENKQYAIDKFNFQLGNVKALPYTLTKIGSFDINSKIWPFLEFYTCTDEEKEALENKIKYESMTVMRIGFLRDFYSQGSEFNYFKGELIRNEVIAEDTHILDTIYDEFMKGVYI